MIAYLFSDSMWHAMLFALFKEKKVVHLYAPGVANTGQRAAQLSVKARRARSAKQLAGACVWLCRHRGMGRRGADAQATKKQKTQVGTTEAKLRKDKL